MWFFKYIPWKTTDPQNDSRTVTLKKDDSWDTILNYSQGKVAGHFDACLREGMRC
jgi:hypothetical protein